MNIDLIIQGPVDGNNVFLSKMDSICKQFDKVIISTWDSDDNSSWRSEVLKHDNVLVTSQALPPRPIDDDETYKGIVGGSTFYWACLSTYNGLVKSSAEYVIKMRTDEYYEDYSLIKKELRKSKAKLVFGNIFYRRNFKGGPYHIGDHLYGCKREYMVNGLNIALKYYNKEDVSELFEFSQDLSQVAHCAEVALSHIFLVGVGTPRSEWYEHQNQVFPCFNKHFKLIDINRLGDYRACWQQGGPMIFSPDNQPYIQAHFDK